MAQGWGRQREEWERGENEQEGWTEEHGEGKSRQGRPAERKL